MAVSPLSILRESGLEDGWPQSVVGQENFLVPFAPMYMGHVAGRDLKIRPSKAARARPQLVEKLSSGLLPCHCSSPSG